MVNCPYLHHIRQIILKYRAQLLEVCNMVLGDVKKPLEVNNMSVILLLIIIIIFILTIFIIIISNVLNEL